MEYYITFLEHPKNIYVYIHACKRNQNNQPIKNRRPQRKRHNLGLLRYYESGKQLFPELKSSWMDAKKGWSRVRERRDDYRSGEKI